MIETRETAWVRAAIVIGMVGHASLYAPQAAFFSELFGTRTRYTGASLGYQLAAPFAGGLAPLVISSLLSWSGGSTWPIVLYRVFLGLVTVVSVKLADETHRADPRSDRAT